MKHSQNAFRDTLQDLRHLMLRRVALLMLVANLFIAYLELYQKPLRWRPLIFALLIALTMHLVYRWSNLRLNMPRYVFVFLLHLQLGGAMVLYPTANMPFLGVLIVMLSALLASNSSFISAPAIFLWAYGLESGGFVDYALVELFGVLVISLLLAYTTADTFYTALSWYSSMYDRAERLLNQVRDRRAELVQALKSLETAYNTQERMKRQLVTAQKNAMEARQMKEQFAANISHELRTPLNLILGFSEILYLTPEVYGNVSLPPRLVRDIYQIYQSSRHLQNLIGDVLDLSHIELSGFGMTFEKTDMNTFMLETIDMIGGLFRDKPVELITHIPAALPNAEIDRTRIRQAIINLVKNAQRFTTQGHVSLSVTVDSNQLVFTVADTGKGIPQEDLNSIFDEFFQLDYSLSRAHGGAGLGLAITRRFVKAHGGTIDVESQPGIGSTFTFTIPANVQQSPEARHDNRSPQETNGALLIVENDQAVVKLLQRNFPQHEVIQVTPPASLLDFMETYHPSAVIINTNPAENGTAHQLAADIPVPTVICSLPSSQWIIDRLQITDYLPKPVSTAQIHQLLKQNPAMQSILIVDDDIGLVQFIQRSIESITNDLQIYRAYDGEQALDVIEQNHIDLVLLDGIMPEVDGFEVIDKLHAQAQTQNIPVILMTASRYMQDEREQRAEMTIRQIDGLHPAEVLRCLQATVNSLEPRYSALLPD